MMNKKAIAAFAAGATLLAGFAMATPAMALDFGNITWGDSGFGTPETVTEAQYLQAKLNLVNGKKALEEKKKALDDADDAYRKATPEEQKKSAVKTGATDPDDSTVAGKRLKAQNEYDAQVKLNEGYQATIDAYEHKATTPATPDPKQPEEVTPSTKAEHIAKLYGLKSTLDDAEGNMNAKLKTYHELFAKLSSVKAEMDTAKANSDAAAQAVQDALAAGLNTSNPSAFKDLTERASRALAHYLGAQKAYNEVKAEFDKAYTEAVKASAAYNAALEAYKKAIDAALAAGLKLPADLPVLTDPLAELNLPVPAGVPTPTVPGQPGQPGKPGKPGKPEVEKKKDDGKKLPKTGVGVTLTALAATMLAGMGAAVRKARH